MMNVFAFSPPSSVFAINPARAAMSTNSTFGGAGSEALDSEVTLRSWEKVASATSTAKAGSAESEILRFMISPFFSVCGVSVVQTQICDYRHGVPLRLQPADRTTAVRRDAQSLRTSFSERAVAQLNTLVRASACVLEPA